jgi:putative hydrolase of the HAD superfamily
MSTRPRGDRDAQSGLTARAASMWILFDIDETLIDHSTAFRAGTAALRRESRSALPQDEFLARWSAAHRRNFDRFLRGELTYEEQGCARVRETLGAELSDDEAQRLFSIYITAYENAWTLFPDALRCLDDLAGLKLGVISNGHSSQQRRKLAKLGIADRFAHVTISQDCGSPKPSAKIFLHACAACGVEPRDAVYVGDMYDLDAEGARRAGLTGVWLDRARTASAAHAGPAIGSLGELPALLASLAGGARR